MPPDRLYYRYRSGSDPEYLTLDQLKRLLRSAYLQMERDGWFQHGMGKDCVDDPHDVGAYVIEELGWDPGPLEDAIRDASEDELFTILEFLFDNVAKPTERHWHPWNNCGWHVDEVDPDLGRAEFRERVNALLGRYENPHVLMENGEVWRSAPPGHETIQVEATGEPSIDDRVRAALTTFRRHGATDDDKRHAVRDLADVLEHLRATAQKYLPTQDEARLFEIANQYAIRHHNPDQHSQYRAGLWLDWIFYAYLNAIALATRLISADQEQTGS